jgi:hypothetical protein
VNHRVYCIAALLAATAPLGAQNIPVETDRETYVSVPFDISLVPGVSIADAVADSRKTSLNISFSLLGGQADRLEGVHYGGLWQKFNGDTHGISQASLINISGGELRGIQTAGIAGFARNGIGGAQLSGIVSSTQGAFDGIQFAGIYGETTGRFRGLQSSGALSRVTESFAGVQAAGFVNTGATSFKGAQFAGLVNVVNGPFRGSQIAGLVNVVNESFSGAQFGGLINTAGSVSSGLQMAGLINITRHAGHETIQLAPVNISERNEGIPVGPVSYVAEHGAALDMWIDETSFINNGVRTGNDRFYNILSAGVEADGDGRWSLGWTFGGNITVSDRFALALDAGIRHINEDGDGWTDSLNNLTALRALGIITVSDHIAFYAGPSLSYFRSRIHDGEKLASWSFYDDSEDGVYHRVWPGFTAGITFR